MFRFTVRMKGKFQLDLFPNQACLWASYYSDRESYCVSWGGRFPGRTSLVPPMMRTWFPQWKIPKLWSQNDSKMVPKLFQNDLKMIPKWSKNDSKIIPKWSQNDPKMIPKWSKNDPKIISEWPQMIPKWLKNDSKIIPKWSQNDPNMIPKLS